MPVLHFLAMLNQNIFRDAETDRIKTEMVGWNVPDVASFSIVNASLYHLEKLLL